MTQVQLAKRVEELEREMRLLKQHLGDVRPPKKTAEDFFGMFHGDADFKKAMELGAAYRRSLRPGRSRRRSRAK
jgi:hypothetical protein